MMNSCVCLPNGLVCLLAGGSVVGIDLARSGAQVSRDTALGSQGVDGSLDGAPHAASDCDSQSRRSPTFQAVTPGPSFTGFGATPERTHRHHVLLGTGIRG
jgi:hypothetical protein